MAGAWSGVAGVEAEASLLARAAGAVWVVAVWAGAGVAAGAVFWALAWGGPPTSLADWCGVLVAATTPMIATAAIGRATHP